MFQIFDTVNSIYILYVMMCFTSYCLQTAYGFMECIYVCTYFNKWAFVPHTDLRKTSLVLSICFCLLYSRTAGFGFPKTPNTHVTQSKLLFVKGLVRNWAIPLYTDNLGVCYTNSLFSFAFNNLLNEDRKSASSCKKFPAFWNLNFLNIFHKKPPLGPTLSQLNPHSHTKLP
jgi:hypothetical protein